MTETRAPHVLVFKHAPGWTPGRPVPTAHVFAKDGMSVARGAGGTDLYSAARPGGDRKLITDQPEFFRLVVPPVFVDVPRQGAVGIFDDAADLREACTRDLDFVMRRFSPASSIANAKPVAIPRMPVVEAALADFPRDHFRGYGLLAVQHLYASTVGMLDALADHGLEHRHMTVVGKSYSTCYGAARALVDRGAKVPVSTLEHSAHLRHDLIMEEAIRRELSAYRLGRKNGTAPAKLLVLDDGGAIIDLVHREFRDLLPHITAVEQTTRGIEKVKGHRGCAIIDVATAPLKNDNEDPLDATSIFQEAMRRREHLQRCGFSLPKELSLIGLGKVGTEVAKRFLAEGYRVRAYDIRHDARHPKGVAFVRDREQFLRGAKMLLSITGKAAVRPPDYDLLPHRALLMQGASSNDELSAYAALQDARRQQPAQRWWAADAEKNRIRYLGNLPELMLDREHMLPATGWVWGEMGNRLVPLGHVARRAQRDKILHFKDKDIYLAKSGFVLNLTDEPDPIPAHLIQCTRGALALGCAQAVALHGKAKGRTTLDPVKAGALHRLYRRLVGDPAKARWQPGWSLPPLPVKPYEGLISALTQRNGRPKKAVEAFSDREVVLDDQQVAKVVSWSPAHVLMDLGMPEKRRRKSPRD